MAEEVPIFAVSNRGIMDKRLCNVYLYTLTSPVIIVTDASKPHAVERYIADRADLDPIKDEDDFEILGELRDKYLVDIASDVPMENIEIASSDDFENNANGYVTYEP